MKLSGWGNFPTLDATVTNFDEIDQILAYYSESPKCNTIVRGLGRSYGDSSLADDILSMLRMDSFIRFDPVTGVLRCYAGVSIEDILNAFVPMGWFLPVTPGTKFITVGGAVACDVHGKNHHIEGCFCDHLLSLKMVVPGLGLIECSNELNSELFRATCGGMGLTGIIVEVEFKLKPINSAYIKQTTIKASNLNETLGLLDEYEDNTYSVAWIDCLATGKKFGRSVLMLGEHMDTGSLDRHKNTAVSIPFQFPDFVLNKYTIKAFNFLYYNKRYKVNSSEIVHYNDFFYPLDNINNWNNMYGKNGFVQYQFVVPREVGLKGVSDILKKITFSQRGSFLAVLKCFGKANNNFLSFPLEGYTLALDFKVNNGVFAFLDELDKVVMDYGGRIYLAKDSRMSEAVFKAGYYKYRYFLDIREKYNLSNVFNSLQSVRLGI